MVLPSQRIDELCEYCELEDRLLGQLNVTMMCRQNAFAENMDKLREDLEMRRSPTHRQMQRETFVIRKRKTSNVKEVIEKYRLNNDANEAPLASLHSIAAKPIRGVVNMLDALKSEVEGKGENSCHCETECHCESETDTLDKSIEKTGGPCRSRRHGPWGGWQQLSIASLAMHSGTEPLAPTEGELLEPRAISGDTQWYGAAGAHRGRAAGPLEPKATSWSPPRTPQKLSMTTGSLPM